MIGLTQRGDPCHNGVMTNHTTTTDEQDDVPQPQLAANGRWISAYDDPDFYRFDMSDDEWYGGPDD